MRAGSWSADQLTDGRVPEHMVTMLGAKKRDAEQLVTTGLWVKVEGGYQFHEWKQWQPSREEVHAKRAEEAERKRKWREKRAADKATADATVPDVSHRDNRVASGGTDASVPDLSRSSRPDPTRPSLPTEERTTGTAEGGSHVPNARASAPPLYPDRCEVHGDEPDPPPCGKCADQRKANATKPRLSLVGPTNPARVPHCGRCDETRHLETPFGVIRCPTCHPLAEESA